MASPPAFNSVQFSSNVAVLRRRDADLGADAAADVGADAGADAAACDGLHARHIREGTRTPPPSDCGAHIEVDGLTTLYVLVRLGWRRSAVCMLYVVVVCDVLSLSGIAEVCCT